MHTLIIGQVEAELDHLRARHAACIPHLIVQPVVPGFAASFFDADFIPQVVSVLPATTVVAEVSFTVGKQGIANVVSNGEHSTTVEISTVTQFTDTATCPDTSAELFAIFQKITGFDGFKGGDPPEYCSTAHARLSAFINFNT